MPAAAQGPCQPRIFQLLQMHGSCLGRDVRRAGQFFVCIGPPVHQFAQDTGAAGVGQCRPDYV